MRPLRKSWSCHPPLLVDSHFADVASTWTTRYERSPSFRARLAIVGGLIDAFLQGKTDLQILDYGGGTGIFSLISTGGRANVVLIDRSKHMVTTGLRDQGWIIDLLGRRGFTSRADTLFRVVGDAACLGTTATSRFDLILAISVLEYLPQPGQVIARLLELTKPSGVVIVSVPNHRSSFRRVERQINGLAARLGSIIGSDVLRDRSYSQTKPRGSEPDWPALIERAGACVLDVVGLPLGEGRIRACVTPTLVYVLKGTSVTGKPAATP